MAEALLEKLRREKEEYRRAYDDAHKEIVQLRARERQLIGDLEKIKQVAVDNLMALDARYKKFFKETLQTLHEHPGGRCADCDMKGLLDKIKAISPTFISKT